jgi:hypothetical protein
MLRLLLIPMLLVSINSIGQNKKSILTMDFVQITNDKRAEAIFFYEKNWKVYRDIALERGFIKSYSLLTTVRDSTTNFDFILITEYTDSLLFKSSEENFQKIIKEINPDGPKLMNELKPTDFRKIVFFKKAEAMFSGDKSISNRNR